MSEVTISIHPVNGDSIHIDDASAAHTAFFASLSAGSRFSIDGRKMRVDEVHSSLSSKTEDLYISISGHLE